MQPTVKSADQTTSSSTDCRDVVGILQWDLHSGFLLLTYQFRISEIQIKIYLRHTFLKSNFKLLLLWWVRAGYGLSRTHGLCPPDDKMVDVEQWWKGKWHEKSVTPFCHSADHMSHTDILKGSGIAQSIWWLGCGLDGPVFESR